MKRIKEVIVVEGKHDSDRLKRYFDCETIETGGSALDEETIELIRQIQLTRGIIIFTDPDAPGNMIRHKINERVPGCKNAFVDKKDARTSKKVGIEHAEKKVLEEALCHLMTYDMHVTPEITVQDFYLLGLLGETNSKEKRDRIAQKYHIGSGNGKTIRARLNCLRISLEELRKECMDDETHRLNITHEGNS